MEEKIKFYSQYLFQDVLVTPRLIWSGNPSEPSHEEWVGDVLTLENIKIVCEHDFPLFLTSLAEISDEDAIEVVKIFRDYNTDIDYKFETRENTFREVFRQVYFETESNYSHQTITHRNVVANFSNDGISVLKGRDSTILKAYDYLRSKGYALYWSGLSVENQVERGWVRLNKE